MKIIEQSWDWLQRPNDRALKILEQAGRTCYKSEDKITEDSAKKFIASIVKRGHETVIEHVNASVVIVTNRSVTHELVRHRLSSFSQESTRYVKYDDDMEFILPVWWQEWSVAERQIWTNAMDDAEFNYRRLIKKSSRAEQAREVLPNSLKTEIVMTANLREWRHVFNLRCSNAAHPQIRDLCRDMLVGFKKAVPVIFDDLAAKYL